MPACNHDWSEWALHIDKTLPRGQQTGWRRVCLRCTGWEYQRVLPWVRLSEWHREHRP